MPERSLVLVGLGMLVLRILYIFCVRDYDSDAYGHFHIGRALLDDPSDIPVHWVWLPGWHFVLAALQRMGLGFRDVRLVQALLASLGPWLVYQHHHRASRFTEEDERREDLKSAETWLAAMLFTICSLANLAGTSALMEVAVTLLLLGAGLNMDRDDTGAPPRRRERRASAWAGMLLAMACAIRYEAWSIIPVLGLEGLVFFIRHRRDATMRERAAFVNRAIVFAIPAACIGAYILFRRRVDGEWLWFIRETYRFTHMQRGLSTHSTLFDLAWFPIVLPFMILGPAIALIPFAIAPRNPQSTTRWRRRSSIIPISLIAFLFATYIGKGSLGQARYLTVLMPFACMAIARGASRVASSSWMNARNAQWLSKAVVAFAIVSVGGATVFMTHRTASSALRRDDNLRALEHWATTPR